MKENQTKNKKKIFSKKVIIILATVFLVAILLIPIRNKIEENLFSSLAKSMGSLYQQLTTIALEDEGLTFEKKCDSQKSGDWSTGMYYCKTIISLEKKVESANEVADIQSRYFDIIDNFSKLSPTTELDISRPNDFGINFVVSSAEKEYEFNKINCKFVNYTYKDDGGSSFENIGDVIGLNQGRLRLTFTCTRLTNKPWYEQNLN